MRLSQFVARLFVRRTQTSLDDRILQLLAPPARLGVALAVFAGGQELMRKQVYV